MQKACSHLGQLNPALQIGHANNHNVCIWRRIKKEFAWSWGSTIIFVIPPLFPLYSPNSHQAFHCPPADLRKCFWMVLSELILGFRSEESMFLFPSWSGNTKLQFAFILRFAKNHFHRTYFKSCSLAGKNPSSWKPSQISFPFLKYFLGF